MVWGETRDERALKVKRFLLLMEIPQDMFVSLGPKAKIHPEDVDAQTLVVYECH